MLCAQEQAEGFSAGMGEGVHIQGTASHTTAKPARARSQITEGYESLITTQGRTADLWGYGAAMSQKQPPQKKKRAAQLGH